MFKKIFHTLVSGAALLVLSTGCTNQQPEKAAEPVSNAEPASGSQPVSKAQTSSNSDLVATVNGEAITREDMQFYELINRIQIEMYKERDKAKYTGAELERVMKFWKAREEDARHPNTLLTQIIRLRAMALLGKEKGYSAAPQEVEKEVNTVKATYAANPNVEAMIREYGEEKFWHKQRSQYQMIALVNKVQQDVINSVKKANPKANIKEVNVLAQKQYEDLLVSQVGSLNIKIINKNS